MEKQELTSNQPSRLGRLIPNAQKAIDYKYKRAKKTPIGSIAMRLLVRTKKKLSLITPLPLIKLRSKPLRSVKEVNKEAYQLLASMPSR